MPVDEEYICPKLYRGMDHDHYDWSPLNDTRPVVSWPKKARVALCVIVTLEHLEWRRPEDAYQVSNLAGGFAVKRPHPSVSPWSHREYGHRVGIFRILDVLEKHGIRATIAMDAVTAEHYPFLVRHCLERGCEIVGHGISVSRMITSLMSEEQELTYIKICMDALLRATGKSPMGWLGPEYGESARTPQLLAQMGIRYVCDWANDDQPYRMKVSRGELHALPVTLPLDDVVALWDRRIGTDKYEQMIRDTFDTLYKEGENNGRLLALHLHPWLMGQPLRIAYLDTALSYIVRNHRVCAGTGSEIIEWYKRGRSAAEDSSAAASHN